MKTFSVSKVYYLDPEDQKKKITSEKAFNAKLKEATEAKEPLPVLIATQTFQFSAAETVDEAVQLAGGNGVGEYENIEVFLGVFEYASSLRQHNWANDVITDSSFTPTEGAIDASRAVTEKVERSKMTQEEKAVAMLNKSGVNVTVEQLRAALEAIKGQSSGASA